VIWSMESSKVAEGVTTTLTLKGQALTVDWAIDLHVCSRCIANELTVVCCMLLRHR
jgi:hypothetical protein